MQTLTEYGGFLWSGTLMTIVLTLGGCALALVMAFVAGLGRLSPVRPLKWLSVAYIEFFRGTSCLVQMFWMFYALPYFGVSLEPLTAGILTLGLNIGAYGAEVVRSAVLAVPRSQREAGIALNYSPLQRLRHIELPQAIPMMLPPFGNLAVDLMKLSAVASLIMISDLTFRAQLIRNSTGETLWPFLAILVIYFIIASVILAVVSLAERRLSAGREGVRGVS
ncbi:MAG: ectoine/hydroxyectoine ABC transporter permease subunit EhuC [Mesorhizobium sp.]